MLYDASRRAGNPGAGCGAIAVIPPKADRKTGIPSDFAISPDLRLTGRRQARTRPIEPSKFTDRLSLAWFARPARRNRLSNLRPAL
jgi:hypothetical protein